MKSMQKNKKNKKIRNLTIGLIALSILSGKAVHLIRGNQKASKIVSEHQDDTIHLANIVAHRGFSSMYPDNSYLSVNAALNSDCVDLIEIDVKMASDNTLFVHHGRTINAENLMSHIHELIISKRDDIISNDFLFLLKRYLNKSNGNHTMIELKDFLVWYSFDKKLLIDVKVNSIDYSLMGQLNLLLDTYYNDIYIQSDCYSFLREMMEIYPKYQYIYIVNSEKSLKNMDMDFAGFTINYSLFDKIELLSDKLYLIYTINSEEIYEKIFNNIKYEDRIYIITDNPDYICGLNKILRK